MTLSPLIWQLCSSFLSLLFHNHWQFDSDKIYLNMHSSYIALTSGSFHTYYNDKYSTKVSISNKLSISIKVSISIKTSLATFGKIWASFKFCMWPNWGPHRGQQHTGLQILSSKGRSFELGLITYLLSYWKIQSNFLNRGEYQSQRV